MNITNIITAVISDSDFAITNPILKEDRGLYLKIKGISLPATYEVDFSTNRSGGESVTMIGNGQGVEIPEYLIKTGKDIYAFLYWVGKDFGRTVYTFKIPNKSRPNRTDITPEPAQQSVIDQTIAKLNEAVEHAPKIGEDGYWYVWDHEEGDYVSTGDKASAGLHYVEIEQEVFPINTDADGYCRRGGFSKSVIFRAYKDGVRVPCTLRFFNGKTSEQGISWSVVRNATAENTGIFHIKVEEDTKPLTQISPAYSISFYFDFEDGTSIEKRISFHVVRDGENGLSIYFSRNDIVVPHDGAGNVKEHAGAVILFKAFRGSERIACGLNRIQGLDGTSTVVVRTQDSTANQTGLIELAWPAGEPVVDQQADMKDFFVYLDVEGKTLEFNCYLYFVRDGADYVLTDENKQEIADMVDIPLVVENGLLCCKVEADDVVGTAIVGESVTHGG